jgi:hypothetical protein
VNVSQSKVTLPVCFVASFLLMCGATAKQMNSVSVWTHCGGVQSEAAFMRS